jgi:hypothetical protein
LILPVQGSLECGGQALVDLAEEIDRRVVIAISRPFPSGDAPQGVCGGDG